MLWYTAAKEEWDELLPIGTWVKPIGGRMHPDWGNGEIIGHSKGEHLYGSKVPPEYPAYLVRFHDTTEKFKGKVGFYELKLARDQFEVVSKPKLPAWREEGAPPRAGWGLPETKEQIEKDEEAHRKLMTETDKWLEGR